MSINKSLYVKNIFKKYNILIDNYYIAKYNNEIISLFNSDIIIDENNYNVEDCNILNFIGLYYDKKNPNFKLAIKYYTMAIEKGCDNAVSNIYSYIGNNCDNELIINYFLMEIEKGNIFAMTYLGSYYDFNENYEMMLKYYLMAINHNNCQAMIYLGYYYYYTKRYDLMKKYYLMAINNGSTHAMCYLARYYNEYEHGLIIDNSLMDLYSLFKLAYNYFFNKNIDLMEKYSLMAIDLGCVSSMVNLGNYYYSKGKYNLMFKYCLMAVNLGDGTAMCILGDYYNRIEKNVELMLKYYEMAVELNNVHAMTQLAIYYFRNENIYDMAIKYYIMITAMTDDNECYTNAYNKILEIQISKPFELYKYLLKLKNEYDNYSLITNKISELELYISIKTYNETIKKAKDDNILDRCIICMEDDSIQVIMKCSHKICIECYNPNSKCYYKFCNK